MHRLRIYLQKDGSPVSATNGERCIRFNGQMHVLSFLRFDPAPLDRIDIFCCRAVIQHPGWLLRFQVKLHDLRMAIRSSDSSEIRADFVSPLFIRLNDFVYGGSIQVDTVSPCAVYQLGNIRPSFIIQAKVDLLRVMAKRPGEKFALLDVSFDISHRL